MEKYYFKNTIIVTKKIHYFHGVTYTFFYFANLRKRVYTYRSSICNFNKEVSH